MVVTEPEAPEDDLADVQTKRNALFAKRMTQTALFTTEDVCELRRLEALLDQHEVRILQAALERLNRQTDAWARLGRQVEIALALRQRLGART